MTRKFFETSGTRVIEFSFSKLMDMHGDNCIMQNLLGKNSFVHCGTIYVTEDNYPRLAYEKREGQA